MSWSIASRLSWDARPLHHAGSGPPQAIVGALQGKHAAMPRVGAAVHLVEGAARCLGAVCVPQGGSAAVLRGVVGVLPQEDAEIPRSAVSGVGADPVAFAATPASARVVGYVAPQGDAPSVAGFCARAAALQEANPVELWIAAPTSRVRPVTIFRLCHAPSCPELQPGTPNSPTMPEPATKELAIVC